MPTRYAIQVTHLAEPGHPTDTHDAGDMLESARIALAGLADRICLATDGLTQDPDAVRFLNRPHARFLTIKNGDQAVTRLTLVDRRQAHCPTCTCAIPAR